MTTFGENDHLAKFCDCTVDAFLVLLTVFAVFRNASSCTLVPPMPSDMKFGERDLSRIPAVDEQLGNHIVCKNVH